jgi:hypothetical protein
LTDLLRLAALLELTVLGAYRLGLRVGVYGHWAHELLRNRRNSVFEYPEPPADSKKNFDGRHTAGKKQTARSEILAGVCFETKKNNLRAEKQLDCFKTTDVYLMFAKIATVGVKCTYLNCGFSKQGFLCLQMKLISFYKK